MADESQIRKGPHRPGQRSNPMIMIALFAILLIVVAVFCWLAFSHQAHDGHGQADPTKQSMTTVRRATLA